MPQISDKSSEMFLADVQEIATRFDPELLVQFPTREDQAKLENYLTMTNHIERIVKRFSSNTSNTSYAYGGVSTIPFGPFDADELKQYQKDITDVFRFYLVFSYEVIENGTKFLMVDSCFLEDNDLLSIDRWTETVCGVTQNLSSTQAQIKAN